MEPCKLCPNIGWCQRHGCTAWNEHSRWKLEELKARSKRDNDLMDDLEKIVEGWK